MPTEITPDDLRPWGMRRYTIPAPALPDMVRFSRPRLEQKARGAGALSQATHQPLSSGICLSSVPFAKLSGHAARRHAKKSG